MPSDVTIGKPAAAAWRPMIGERRGVLVAALVFLAALAALLLVSPTRMTYGDLSNISASATTLALAATGLTIVVLAGGLDLSSVAVVSLVNVLIVTWLRGSGLGVVAYTLTAVVIAVGVGALVGAVNGVLVGYFRLQSVVVTLGIMFICQGAALLAMPYPGGEVSPEFSAVFVGDLVTDLLPMPVVVLAAALAIWVYVRSTRLGVAVYATGSDAGAAAANRVDVRRTRFAAFVLAGAFSGLAGLFLTANTGSGDPLIGAPMMLKVFAAVVLGGTAIGGGVGGAVGSVFGALTLTVIVNVFLVLGVPTYYVPIVEGVVLVLAVIGLTGVAQLPVVALLRDARSARRRRPAPAARAADPARHVGPWPGWLARNRAALRVVLPAYLLLIAAIAATALADARSFQPGAYLVTLLVFTTFLAIAGLGQGAVIISGGLDLSVGWAITFPGIIVTSYANASDAAAVWAIPLALLAGCLIGLANGALVVGLRLSPIIATLAVGSIIEGVALVFSGGAPIGQTPPMLAAFVTGRLFGLPPMVWFLFAFVAAATLLIGSSAFGRRLRATGSAAWVATLSGVRTGRVMLLAYVLSGFCAAIVGVLLTGFASNAYYDMGKPYLLASIAAVVLGGASITGGRGYYSGIFGGALLFTALGSLLASTALPEAMRSVVYGVILLSAVAMLRDRQTT